MPNCRQCGKPIRFIKTKNNRIMPIEMDSNEPHFAVCGKTPEMFTRAYWEPLEKIKNADKRITNPMKKKSFYRGETPPWEFPTFIDCLEQGAKSARRRRQMEDG